MYYSKLNNKAKSQIWYKTHAAYQLHEFIEHIVMKTLIRNPTSEIVNELEAHNNFLLACDSTYKEFVQNPK
jgi:hypothetical protein